MASKLILPDLPRAKMFEHNGIMARVWQEFFRKLYVRTGGDQQLTNTEIAEIINHDNLIAERILFTNPDTNFESVADLTAWINGTTDQIIATDNGDGTITLSTPQDIDTFADVVFNSLEVDALYIGDQDTNGSWRFVTDGDNLNFEKRELGVWVRKGDVRP